MRNVLTSCHLSKYASHFESEGYDVVQFLLDATESELAAVFAVMKEFERRRVLSAIGIAATGLHASPAPPEADETAETSEQSAPSQVVPMPSVVPTGNCSSWLLWSSKPHAPIGFSGRNGLSMFMATKAFQRQLLRNLVRHCMLSYAEGTCA
jgi:hypothetical protein